jgi:RNA polymerase sigma-70 factor (sigma-E family)
MATDRLARDAAFTAFVHEATPSLMRSATLLTGSTHAAQELVQASLVKAYTAWHRIEPGTALAYTRRILVNQRTDAWRRTKGEVSVESPPDRATTDPSTVEDRDRVVRLLARLPEQQRKVVVLRYYTDLSERATADALGLSVSAVKSLTHRAMTTLRTAYVNEQEDAR